MNGGQTCPLSGVIEPAKLVVAHREVSVASFHIGTWALKHCRQLTRQTERMTTLTAALVSASPRCFSMFVS